MKIVPFQLTIKVGQSEKNMTAIYDKREILPSGILTTSSFAMTAAGSNDINLQVDVIGEDIRRPKICLQENHHMLALGPIKIVKFS